MDRNAALKLRSLAGRIVFEEGFTINADKTRLMGQGNRQIVTGVVVNQTLGLSRQERRRLRAMAHRLSHQPQGQRASALRPKLEGKVAYLSMLNAQQAARLKLPAA
ncbi:RNA-directed DNA polymerase from retron Mx65 (fragment) [Verrucomicrobia bacterium]